LNMDAMLPAAIAITATMIAAIWAMTHGSTIGASAEVEKRSSVWGASLSAFGAFLMVVDLLFVIVLVFGGGEGGMIPESAWPLLTGALTMIGAGFAAALCIMVAAKAGAEMLIERPELSIWSLLFVALGEGLAIYGLIVAILLSGG
jgi:F0F1-type ATP synthase membrane subunit c/vacuolar-type H+-ATPase subunit K